MASWRSMMAGGAIVATLALALTPAIGHISKTGGALQASMVSLNDLGSIGSFTPVTNDKALARAYVQAMAGAHSRSFRFTPTISSISGNRSITIVVRSPSITDRNPAPTGSTSSTIGLGPVAYNLGSARGLERFAVEGAGTRELDPVVTALTPPRDFTIAKKPSRLSAGLALDAQTQAGAAPQTLAGEKIYAVDLASSYKLTRNLDVSAGVRYKGRQDRLAPITDSTQDSKAVYIGTTFRF